MIRKADRTNYQFRLAGEGMNKERPGGDSQGGRREIGEQDRCGQGGFRPESAKAERGNREAIVEVAAGQKRPSHWFARERKVIGIVLISGGLVGGRSNLQPHFARQTATIVAPCDIDLQFVARPELIGNVRRESNTGRCGAD